LLNDEIIYPIVEVAENYQVSVWLYTGTPIHSLSSDLRDNVINFPGVNFIMSHVGA